MAAVRFIENRAAVQTQAQNYIADLIRRYNVETRGERLVLYLSYTPRPPLSPHLPARRAVDPVTALRAD